MPLESTIRETLASLRKSKVSEEDLEEVFSKLTSLGKQAVDPLIVSLLNDEMPYVRANVALVLGEIGDQKAVEPLMLCLQDKEDLVKQLAAEALGMISDPRAIDSLMDLVRGDVDPEVRDEAEWALEQIGRHGTQALIEALQDSDEYRRARAAYILAAIKAVDAFDALLSLLEDTSPSVRLQAVAAIGIIGGPRAIAFIEPLLGDADSDVCRITKRTIEALKNK